jgi:predicted phage tail protein
VTAGTVIAKSAVYLGASLVLSGVSEMLFPIPKPQEFKSEQDPQLSFSFSGTQNTSRAGTPVPIVYGEIITGSVVISGAVDTQQVKA